MNIYVRVLVLAAVAAVSLTQGCSCSSSNKKKDPVVVDPPEPPTQAVTTISGAAAKGLILGGIVNIHPIIEGVLSDSIIGTGVTGTEDGDYSIQIDDYDGSPLVVRVTAADDGSTSMICDLAAGCGGSVVFGGTVTIDDADFNLDAIVPPVTDSTASVNLSVLTDTATSLALDALTSGVTVEETITAISNANTSIANRFSIQGDITTLPVVNLADPNAVATASNNVINFNLLSASIVEAMMIGDNTLTIASAVNSFTTQFVDEGGLADTEDSAAASVTLAEILAQASALIDAIQVADTEGLVDLTTIETIIDANQSLAEQGSTTPDAGTPSTTNDLEPLEKARALVAVLGDLGHSIDMTVLAEGVTLGAEAEELEAQLEIAALASSDGVEQVLEATAKVVEAFGEAYDAYDSYEGSEPFVQWQSSNGVVVSIAEVMSMSAEGEAVTSVRLTVGSMIDDGVSPASIIVDIDGVMSDVAVYMMATEALRTEETETDGVEIDSIMGALLISGTAETAEIKLTVQEGSGVTLDELVSSFSETEVGEQGNLTLTELEFNLMAMLEQKQSATVTDPVSFMGKIAVSLESLEANETVTWTDSGAASSATEEISVLALSLMGSVMNSSDDAVNVVFSIEGDGTGLDFSQDWLGDFDSDDRADSDPEADSFAATRVSLALEADMAGVNDAFKIIYTMIRSDHEAATMTLNMWYSNINLQFFIEVNDDDATDQTATLSNQDGVLMTIMDTGDGIIGEIFANTIKVADIDGALVTYTIEEIDDDGQTFTRQESLDIFE